MSNRWLRGSLLLSVGAMWGFSIPLLGAGQFLLAISTASVLGGICYLSIRHGLRIPTSNPVQLGSIPLTVVVWGLTLLLSYPAVGVVATYLVLESTGRLPAFASKTQDFSGMMAYIQAWQGKVIIGTEVLSAIVIVIGLAYVLPERARLYDETHNRYPLSPYQAYCRQQGRAAIGSGITGIVCGCVLMALGSTALIGIFLFVGGLGALLAGFDWTDSWPLERRTLPVPSQRGSLAQVTTGHAAATSGANEATDNAVAIKALAATVLAVTVVAGTLSITAAVVPPHAKLSSVSVPTPFRTFALAPRTFTGRGGSTTEFLLPASTRAAEITTGPDHNLWFTADLSLIGRMTPTGAVTEYLDCPPCGGVGVIIAGPDGNLWFTAGGSSLGRITTTGIITEFPLPAVLSLPRGITAGPDGNLWFTEFHTGKIGRISPKGAITEFPLPAGVDSLPYMIATGPDGNLWFTESGGNAIGRISPASAITEFPLPVAKSEPLGITAGPDGKLWFTERSKNRIGKITLTGKVTEYPLPNSYSAPYMITAGTDGDLWFTEFREDSNSHISASTIGRISPQGAITEYALPDPTSGPTGITAGPDGHVWFTAKSEIGYITA